MTPAGSPEAEVRRAASRFHTDGDGRDSWHSFSFGAHHDPGNLRHGQLLAHNEERLPAGRGFDPHRHREMEIVTWVLSGRLAHEDSLGNAGELYPLLAQRMSAGSGVTHAERNAAPGAGPPVHFVQMWIEPDEYGLAPSYQQCEVPPEALAGRLAPIASGLAKHASSTAIELGTRSAGFSVARLGAGQSVEVPDAEFAHLFVATGSVDAEGTGALATGDAIRYRRAGARRITATSSELPAELLVWEMSS